MSEVVITQTDSQTLEMAREDIVRVEGHTSIAVVTAATQGPAGPAGPAGPEGTQALAEDERAHLLALPLATELEQIVGGAVADATASLATSAELAGVADIVQTLPDAIPSLAHIEGAVAGATESLAKTSEVDAARDAVLAAIQALPPPAPSAFVGEVRAFSAKSGEPLVLPAGWQADTAAKTAPIDDAAGIIQALPAAKPTTPTNAQMTLVAQPASGRVYISSPSFSSTSWGNAIYALDPAGGEDPAIATYFGLSLTSQPPAGCLRGAAAVFCGGAVNATAQTRHVEISEEGELAVLQSMPRGLVTHAVAGHIDGDRMMLFGGSPTTSNGVPNSSTAETRVYKRSENAWTQIDNGPAASAYAKAGVLPSGRFLVMGDGFGANFAILDIDAPSGAQWSALRSRPFAQPWGDRRFMYQTAAGVAAADADGRVWEYSEALDEWQLTPWRLPKDPQGPETYSWNGGAAVYPISINGEDVWICASSKASLPFYAIGRLGTSYTKTNARYTGEL